MSVIKIIKCPKCKGTGVITYANMGETTCFYCWGKKKITTVEKDQYQPTFKNPTQQAMHEAIKGEIEAYKNVGIRVKGK